MACVAGRAFVLPSPIYHPEVRVTQVACGNEHCVLLTETGQVFSWGIGRYEGVLWCKDHLVQSQEATVLLAQWLVCTFSRPVLFQSGSAGSWWPREWAGDCSTGRFIGRPACDAGGSRRLAFVSCHRVQWPLYMGMEPVRPTWLLHRQGDTVLLS